jgi:hypothetical protein
MDLTAEQIKLVNILDKFFKKADDIALPHLYSTSDIFQRLQSVYPSELYSTEDVYQVLCYKDFDFIHSTSNKICWLVQENGRVQKNTN